MAQKNMTHLFCVFLVLSGALLSQQFSQAAQDKVTVQKLEGKVRIEINGELFSEYIYQNTSRPILYPVIGPGGAALTRNWPMQEGFEDEAKDHPHHRSLWYSHGDVNGHDFWSESARAGKIVHEKLVEAKSDDKGALIKTRNNWVARDGTIICTDEQTIRVQADSNKRFIDYNVTLHASNGDVVLGDTKEGTMAIRLAPTLRLKGKVGQGTIVNSEGVRDGATWGKRAKWCDYHGPVDGRTVGVAIFDHPDNPKHPTWWHVRDYGLFAANPFGVHDFERKPAGTGNVTVPAGESITFRYRFYLHEGDEKEAGVERHYQEYVSEANK
jgi:hypothetical protein